MKRFLTCVAKKALFVVLILFAFSIISSWFFYFLSPGSKIEELHYRADILMGDNKE